MTSASTWTSASRATRRTVTVAVPQHAQRPVGAGPRLGESGGVRGDRADADHRRRTAAHPVQEVRGDANGALLAVGAAANDRDEAVHDVADQRGGAPRVYRAQVHRERVGEPLPFGGRARVGAEPADRVGGFEDGESQHHHGLVGQAEAAERLAGAHAALQRGADQVGTEPALDVGAGPDAQHVQRDDPGAVA